MPDEIAPVEVPAEQIEQPLIDSAAPPVETQPGDAYDAMFNFASRPNDDPFAAPEVDDADPEPAAPNAEVESLRQQLAERDNQIAALNQHLEAQLAAQRSEIERRMSAAIDAFASPKYGVGRNRNIAQLTATNALREKIRKTVNALAHAGEQIDSIETIAARVRQFDDDSFVLGAKPPAPCEPLGTPGVGRGGSKIGGEQPRTIHHALQMNSTF